MKPVTPRPLPLGATATLIAELTAAETSVAVIPASAITQSGGQPALWVVRRAGAEPVGTVELISVVVHGYRNDEVLVSAAARRARRHRGCAEDGARIEGRAARFTAQRNKRAGRPMKSFNLTEWALGHRAIVLFLILVIAVGGVLGFTKLGQLEDPTSRCRR